MVSLGCGLLILQFQSLIAVVLSLALYLVVVMFIRNTNTKDAQFFYALYRYLRYFADYYPANAFYSQRNNSRYNLE
jgi:type IV secretory pathway TrbD component